MKYGLIVKEGSREELTAEKSLTELYLELYAPPVPAAPAAVKEVAADA